ncbi:phosphodiester glycosidase family protein [Oculatella sp. LEGE 06141]|uniref:phosphodiester glycosidase family protein n=1 Tax=Oculatella sp. LEGE 06141 TaxID=1828648 RepID=UPI00187F7427|nr:phosphodiester glycosidase family protein [Oculatella sp. LEGE 06141]MBE9180418.1 phosphodiester glycosidase family protein [Oculatella sp. LEGE 06141]
MRHRYGTRFQSGFCLAIVGLGIGLGFLWLLRVLSLPPRVLPVAPLISSVISSPPPVLQYESRNLGQSTVHILHIPAQSRFRVTVARSPAVDSLTTLAQASGAIAAINGGFFDPSNQQSTSYVIQRGAITDDPTANERLMQNPDLVPYLPAILNRSEFRQYTCRDSIRYEIARHRDPVAAGCQLISALGGGPQLLPTMTLEDEGFITTVDGAIVRDPLGSRQPNARSAVGLTREGDVIWMMVAQVDAPSPSGLPLAAIAELMAELGANRAMNLDGGSSSAFYYNGETWYGKVDAAGNPVVRPVKSALVVEPVS